MIRCPECNAALTLPEGAELWDHIFCPACGAELEIISVNPPEVEVVYDAFDGSPDEMEEPDEEPWEDEEETDDDEIIYPWEGLH